MRNRLAEPILCKSESDCTFLCLGQRESSTTRQHFFSAPFVHGCASYQGLRHGKVDAYNQSCNYTTSKHTNSRLRSHSGCALTSSSNGIRAAHESHSTPCVLAPAAAQMARPRADYSRCADVPDLHCGRCMCPATLLSGSPFARVCAIRSFMRQALMFPAAG
jgi:hypothetical protein